MSESAGDPTWTALKHFALGCMPQWWYRWRRDTAFIKYASERIGLHFDVRGFFGKEAVPKREWKRMVEAHRELVNAMMLVGARADEDEQQVAMGKWIADVIRSGNRAGEIMSMIYPDEVDAPWKQ